jgi:hypothetical protein
MSVRSDTSLGTRQWKDPLDWQILIFETEMSAAMPQSELNFATASLHCPPDTFAIARGSILVLLT